MNKRERVFAAFHNEPVDHVPGCFWRHFSPELERGEDVVEAHLKFYRDTDVDLLKISSDGYFGWPEKTLQVGWDKMMECMKADPEAVKYACDVIANDEIELIRALILEAGVDGIFYSVQNAEVTRFTLEEYKAWVEPSDRKVLDFTNSISDMNVLHCCGWDADEANTHNHLESWKDYPSAAVSWAAFVDKKSVSEIREFFNGRPAWGGFDNRTCGLIYQGTEEQIKEEALNLIQQGTKTGYMLGPDCSLPNDIDPKRIKWVIEAARSV